MPGGSSISAMTILLAAESSEFRAAIDMNRIAGDPAGVVGSKEGDHTAYIVRLGEALQDLHAEGEIPARIGLGEVRHIGLDHARGDSVDADTASAEERGELLHESVDGAFGCSVRRDRTDNATRRQR